MLPEKEISTLSISQPLVRCISRRWVELLIPFGRPDPNPKAEKGDVTMRFMMMVKSAENSGPPPQELMDAMAKLTEEAAKSGTMVAAGGLAPTAKSTRVRLSRGQVTVIDGPFTEAKEVVGGYAVFDLKSKEEAIEGALRFIELHKKYWPGWEGESEIRQVFGPEDFDPCA
jgi:hypothetical protein